MKRPPWYLTAKVNSKIDNPWIFLILRILLGGIFVIAAIFKLHHHNEFINIVNSYGILPAGLAALYGGLLPWLEVILGVFLISGFRPRITVVAGGLITISFIIANIYAIATASSGNGLCGCFGSLIPLNHTQSLIADFLMLFMAVILMVHPSRWLCFKFSFTRHLMLRTAGAALVLIVLVTTFIPMAAYAVNDSEIDANIINTKTITETETETDADLPSNQPVLMFFHAESCSYCQKENPIISELENEYSDRISFVSIDTMQQVEMVAEMKIKSLPTMLLFTSPEATEEYQRFEGFTEKQALQCSLDALLGTDYEGPGETTTYVSGCNTATETSDNGNKTTTVTNNGTLLNPQIDSALVGGKSIFLFFYAEWCHYCQQEQPIISELEEQYAEDIIFIKAEGEAYPEDMVTWGVTSFPSMFLIVEKIGESYVYQDFGGFTEKDVLAASFNQLIETGSLPEESLKTGYVHHSCSVATCYENCIADKFEFPSLDEVEIALTDVALDCLGAEARQAFQTAYDTAKLGSCAYKCGSADSPREYGDCAQCAIEQTIGKIPVAGCVVDLWNFLGDLLEPHADCLAECAADSSTWEKNWGHPCRDHQVNTSRCAGANVMEAVSCDNCEYVVDKVYICDGGCEQTASGAACKGKCNEADCDDGDECTIDWCYDGECQHERKSDCCPQSCDDGDSCTTDFCDGSGACQHSRQPYCCPGGCDDGDHCTQDWCGESGCEHARIPGCDKPDDNNDVSTQSVGDLPPITFDARIAVLNNGFATNVLENIDKFGYDVNLVDTTLRGIEKHSVLIIPSGGLTGLDTSPLFRSRLEQYVADGGTLIVFAQQQNSEFEVLPGGEVRGVGWGGDQSCHYRSAGMATYHPIFAGQRDLISSLNLDGFFTAYPEDTTILLLRVKNGQPAMIKYGYGRGTVLATNSFDDMGGSWIFKSTMDGNNLIHDILAWATSINEIETYGEDTAQILIPVTNPNNATANTTPQYHPGDLIEANLNITNTGNMTVDTVIFQVSDPDYQLTSVNATATILPGDTQPVAFSYLLPADASPGIWTTLYFLYVSDEFINAGIANKFTVDYNVDSKSNMQAYITVINPEGKTVIDTTYEMELPPGQSGNVQFPIPSAGDQLGIWTARYSVVWDDGSVLKSSEERFAISKYSETTDGWVYEGSDLLFYIDTPDENPTYYSDVTFTVHAINRGDTDKDITSVYFADSETRQSWAAWSCTRCISGGYCDPLCVIQPMHTPAGGEAYFSYTHPKVYSLLGSAFDAYFYDETGEQIGYTIRGIQPHYNTVNTKLVTDKTQYFVGEPITANVTFKATEPKVYDITGKVVIVSVFDKNTPISEQAFEAHLDGTSPSTSIVRQAIILPCPDSLGTYEIRIEADSATANLVGSVSRNIKVSYNYSLTAAYDREDRKYHSGDPLIFNVTVKNFSPVPFAAELTVINSELGINETETVLLGAGENITFNYSTIVPEDTYPGSHVITSTITAGGIDKFIKSIFQIPYSKLELNLSTPPYKVGDNLTLNVANTGGVGTTASCSLRIMGTGASTGGEFDLAPDESGTIILPIPLPIPGGTYKVEAICQDSRKTIASQLLESTYIDGSKLELSLDAIEYNDGDTVSATLTNTGGLDTSGQCNIVLKDPSGYAVYEDNRLENVSGNTSITLDLTIPGQSASGTYRVKISCTDINNGTVAMLSRKITVNGVGAGLTSITDQTIYLADDDILIQTDITNSDAAIDNGVLNLQIWQAVSEEGGATEDWVARYSGAANSSNQANDMVTDSEGNVYVTGSSYEGNNGNYVTVKYDSEGNQQWVVTYNGEDNGHDAATAIAVDSDGNVYVTGMSHKKYTLNPTQMHYDCVTVKYNAAGIQQWTARYNGPATGYNHDEGRDIAVDSEGNVAVTGTSYGSGDTDFFTIEYSPDGTQLWLQRYNGPSDYQDGGNAIAIDSDGNVYVTGYSYADYNCDYTTIKYDINGIQQWIAHYDGGSLGYDEAKDIVIDNNNYVYITGSSSYDFGTVKYDSNGNLEWAEQFNGAMGLSDEGIALAVDTTGNVFVTGVTVVGISGEMMDLDIATIKYNAIGDEEWAAYYGNAEAANTDAPTGIALDADGNVYITGSTLNTSRSPDFMTIKYNGINGDKVWSMQYNTPESYSELPVAIAVGQDGKVYVTGYGESATGADFVTIAYTQEGGGGSRLVWETDVPLSLAASEIREIETTVNIHAELSGLTGKFFHRAYLENSHGQAVASSEPYDFFITATDLGLTMDTDKDFYRPGETVIITGSVTNSAAIADDVTLEITKDGGVIYSESFSIGTGESYPFSTITQAQDTFILRATANNVTVSDIIEVVPYGVTLNIISPDVAGLAPFDVDIIIENASETDYNVTAAMGGDIWNIELDAGGYRVIETTTNITEDTLYTATLSGDVIMSAEKLVIMGEMIVFNVTPELLYLPGSVEIPFSANNTGILDISFEATLEVAGQSVTKSVFAVAGSTIDGTAVFELEAGRYELIYNSPYGSGSVEVVVAGETEFIVSELPGNTDIIAGDPTWVIKVKNTGGVGGYADLTLRVPDWQDRQFVWIEGGEEGEFSFTFTIPDDLEEKNYKAEYELNGIKGDFPFHLQGPKVTVDASLDRNLYEPGETAVLTLNVTNTSPFELDLFSRVQLGDDENTEPFALAASGNTELVYNIMANFTNGKVFYGIYMASGRALYLNALYLNEKHNPALWTDKQVYDLGDTVTIYVEPQTGGKLDISAPGYSEQITLTGATTLQFTLPPLVTGTYYIDYTFDGFTSSYPFDVRGYSARITDFGLDKGKYTAGETMHITTKVEASPAVNGTVRCQVIDFRENIVNEFENGFSLTSGENDIDIDALFSSPSGGMHTLICRLYADISGQSHMLVSAAQSFDAAGVNEPPLADAGLPYFATEGSVVIFDAGNSYEPNNEPMLYRWDFDSDSSWDTEWSTSASAYHTYGDNWNGYATLEVSDGTLSATDVTEVKIENVPPIVFAGPDKEVNKGQSVQFNGSFTDYGELDTHTIAWDFGDGSSANDTLTPSYIYQNEGLYTVTLTVTDDDGATGIDNLLVNVNSVPLAVTTESLPAGDVGIPYSATIEALGGVLPYIWSINNPALPDGLTLDPATGDITGTPSTAGIYTFTVMVIDNEDGTFTQDLSITINEAPTIITDSLPDGQVDVAYNQTLAFSGGTPPGIWTISTPALPDGLMLDPTTGIITGTPTTVGTADFTIQLADSLGATDTQALSIWINPAPLGVTTTSLPDGQVGVFYSQTLAAAGGVLPYTWEIAEGTLPAGLSLDAATGAITGTPTTAGTTPFTVQVRDNSETVSMTQPLSITVNAAPAPAGDGGGGGGGGGGGSNGKTITSLRGSTSSTGVAWADIQAVSMDTKAILYIPYGTKCTNANGNALSSITITQIAGPDTAQAGVTIVGTVYELGPKGAGFDPYAMLTIKYDETAIPTGTPESTLSIAIWDAESKTYKAIDCQVDMEANKITAFINHFLRYTIISAPRQAEFTLSGLSISPASVIKGNRIDISISVSNTGDVTGSYSISLSINNAIIQTKRVSLSGGGSERVSFSITPDIAGEHTVSIGSLSGSFRVLVPPAAQPVATPTLIGKSTPTTTPIPTTPAVSTPAPATTGPIAALPTEQTGTNWLLIGGIIGGVIVVGLLAYIFIRRRQLSD